jgi:hypothetical protein
MPRLDDPAARSGGMRVSRIPPSILMERMLSTISAAQSRTPRFCDDTLG